VSCGEYIWDHRNGSSLTSWFADYYVASSEYGLGNPNVDGFYLDDHWSSRPSEENWPCSLRGTGAGRCAALDANETAKMHDGWVANMATVQTAIVNSGGYDWQNFQSLHTPDRKSCSSFLRNQCRAESVAQTNAVQFAISYQFSPDFSRANLTNFDMDLGVFLASRGPFAWLGFGWMGCGCGWEHKGVMPCDIYQRPSVLDLDYGEPTGLCEETADGSQIFTREWTKSAVTVDCKQYKTTIVMH
jgi:hypothetical protein